MDFGAGWYGWLEALVFSSYMSVLVNECPMDFGAGWYGWLEALVFSSYMSILVNECPMDFDECPMDFGVGWCGWLEALMFSSYMCVLVNECSTGGGDEGKKICWVSWDIICLSKAKWGLGVKHCCMFNLSLLSKWKWRILNDESSSWANFLVSCYGDVKIAALRGSTSFKKASLWWRDLCALWDSIDIAPHSNCFSSSISCKLDNDKSLDFWSHD
ncbi:hypothetical protein KIW84_050994 [Lathyrus oleraceus]|uniref:Uncharacterized protein n=1 Tax=Pisum sativum TaxID=3888 RepID=A0A9D5AFD1_PEA|nr:hypothetical protein KIW84_050994 [Pisum sativum]